MGNENILSDRSCRIQVLSESLGGTQTRQEGYNFCCSFTKCSRDQHFSNHALYIKFPNATQFKQEKFNHYSNDVVSQNG